MRARVRARARVRGRVRVRVRVRVSLTRCTAHRAGENGTARAHGPAACLGQRLGAAAGRTPG